MQRLSCLRYISLFLLLVQSQISYAQLPPNQPEQDCFGALPICNDIYIQTDC